MKIDFQHRSPDTAREHSGGNCPRPISVSQLWPRTLPHCRPTSVCRDCEFCSAIEGSTSAPLELMEQARILPEGALTSAIETLRPLLALAAISRPRLSLRQFPKIGKMRDGHFRGCFLRQGRGPAPPPRAAETAKVRSRLFSASWS
jgi:hypothetical protein